MNLAPPPVSVTSDTMSGTVPVLLTVIVSGAEVVPVVTPPKSSAPETDATGVPAGGTSTPVPLTATVLGEFAASL